MALTRITKGVIKPNENYDTHNINSTGIVTAIGLDVNGNGDISGNLNVGGVLTYEDVTSIDSVGVITARSDLNVDGHTNLDNVSVAGVTTFSNNVHVGTGITFETNGQATFSGITTSRGYEVNGYSDGAATYNYVKVGRLKIYDNGSNNHIFNGYAVPLYLQGSHLRLLGNDILLYNTASSRYYFRGQNLGAASLYWAGSNNHGVHLATTEQGIEITGHSELDNVSIAGVTSCANSIHLNQAVPEIKFNSTTHENDFRLINYQGNFIIQDEDALANRLVIESNGDSTFQRNVIVSGNIDVDGHTNLDNVSIAGVVTATSFVGALPITGDTNNRLITATGSGGLNGEANLTFSGSVLGLNQPSVDSNYVLDANGGGIFTKAGTFTSNDFNKGHLTVRNTTASQGAFLDLRAASSGGALGVIAKIGGFNTYSGMGYDGALTFSTRQNSTNTMVERVRITSNGRLLINHNSSRAVANVTAQVQLEGTTANTSAISIVRNSASAFPPYLNFGKSRATSTGGTTIINDDDSLGQIRFSGADGNDLTNHAASIEAFVDGTPGNNVTPGRLIFSTTSATGSDATEKFRISSNGQVCIGSGFVGGGGHLTIRGGGVNSYATQDYQYVGTPSNNSTTLSQIRFTANTTGASVVQGAKIQAVSDAAWSATGDSPTRLEFYTAPDGSATMQERLRINSSGAVMINTTNSSSRTLNLRGNFGILSTNQTGVMTMDVTDAGVATIAPFVAGGSTLILKTNASGVGVAQRLRIQSNGYVNIGSGTAEEQLTIRNTTQHCLIRIISANNSSAGVDFGDPEDTDIGRVRYYHSDGSNTNYMRFDTNASERVRITSGGQVNIGGDYTQTSRKVMINSGNTNAQLEVKGLEADIWMHSTGSGNTIWRILGCTGNTTHRFRIYDQTNSAERFAITSDGYVGISEPSPHAGLTVGKLGDYPTSDGNTYYVPVGKWSTSWNSTNAIVDNTDYWVGYTGGYLKNGCSVNISLAPNRGNTNNQSGMYISGEATGIVSADFTVGKIIGGSATGRGTSGNVRATKSELFRITSSGQLLQGETSAFDSNTAIQFRKDVSGNHARFIFRNRANNGNSRVNIQLSTLNRAANADVSSGIEKYQNGGMAIYNGENSNQYSNINFFTNGWRSLQLRNGNHSGAWCAEIDAYWGTSNGLRMEVGGPQSGTWQAIDFHTSHTGTQRGYIGVTYGGVSYNSSSDYRMKQDVVDMTGAIDRVKLFLPKRFKWKEDPTHTVDGFLAHEAATVVPESVQGEKDGEQMQVMDNSKLVPVLTAALKEAIAKIETLETKVAALESS